MDDKQISSPEPTVVRVELAPYNSDWPIQFERQAAIIRRALGAVALAIEHVGSTAVPGLAAKPVLDILLAVKDSSQEASYAPALEAEGFALRVREPEWFEHRMFRHASPVTNLHVFSTGCAEATRVRMFRDWLCAHEQDRLLYEATKRELAARPWPSVQDYADAKAEVVREILQRAGIH